MMTRLLWLSAVLLAGLSTGTAAHAAGSKRANAKADAWLGRDASELLLQLRVDGGRVDIVENDETGETSYTWSTWNPAWRETVVTGGELSYGSGGPGATLVGVTPGGNGVAGAPIYRAPTQTHYVEHEATHRCDITFHANMEGIISRWEYVGDACVHDIARPKR